MARRNIRVLNTMEAKWSRGKRSEIPRKKKDEWSARTVPKKRQPNAIPFS